MSVISSLLDSLLCSTKSTLSTLLLVWLPALLFTSPPSSFLYSLHCSTILYSLFHLYFFQASLLFMPLPSSLLCSLHFSTILYSFHFPEIHFSDCCALHASTLFASLLSSLFSSVHFSDFCALHVSTLFSSLLTLLLHYSLVSSVPYIFQTSVLFTSLPSSLLYSRYCFTTL